MRASCASGPKDSSSRTRCSAPPPTRSSLPAAEGSCTVDWPRQLRTSSTGRTISPGASTGRTRPSRHWSRRARIAQDEEARVRRTLRAATTKVDAGDAAGARAALGALLAEVPEGHARAEVLAVLADDIGVPLDRGIE